MYCEKCGEKLNEGAMFCHGCGAPITQSDENGRKQSFAGEIVKCPSCGEILSAFEGICPSCGFELRNIKSSKAVSEFAYELKKSTSNSEKANIIRNFPVPHTREDILEFLILASSNIEEDIQNDISEAWKSKMDQTYQKATVVINDEKELEHITELYKTAEEKLKKKKSRETVKSVGNAISQLLPVLPNTFLVFGWLISIFVLIPLSGTGVDVAGFNASQLLLWIDFIIGAVLIPLALKCDSYLPRLVTVLGLLLSIIVIIPKCSKNLDVAGFNGYQLILIIDIICSAVILVRMFKNHINADEKKGLNGASIILTIGIIVILLIIYGITSLLNPSGAKEATDYNYEEDDERDYNDVFQWPEDGLAVKLPKPSGVNGEIEIDRDDFFKIYVYNMDKESYERYISECEEKGFVVDAEKNTTSYNAYDSEGYKLHLSYDKDDKYIFITLETPIKMTSLSWPTSGIATKLPVPKSLMGKFATNSSDTFSVYICETSLEDFNAYVDECIANGFDVDYSRYDQSYYAEDKDGADLTITFEGNEIMYISIYDWSK